MTIPTTFPIFVDGAPHRPDPRLAESLKTHIADAAFPCVGAKSALAQDGLGIEPARDITRDDDDRRSPSGLTSAPSRRRCGTG